MSWLLNCFSERAPCKDLDLLVELRIADEEDDDFSSSSSYCRPFACIQKAITSLVSPLFVTYRTVSDFSMRYKPDIVSVEDLGRTNHFSRNPAVMKELLKAHRNDPSEKGFYSHMRIGNNLMSTFNQIFTKEGHEPSLIQLNDGIMTCEPKFTIKYRDFLRMFFAKNSIHKHFPSIEKIVDDTLNDFEEINGEMILNNRIKHMATKVMANLFLGIEKSSEELSKAISNIVPWLTDDFASSSSFLFRFTSHYFPKLKFITEDTKNETGNKLREAVDQAIKNALEEDSSESIVKEMLKKKYTHPQIRIMIVTLFVAGQDNVSTSLTHIILKLAQDKELQKKIAEENCDPMKSPLIRALLSESLRMFCPIGGIGRDVLKDLVLTLKNKTDGSIISKTFIKKGDGIGPSPFFAAKDPGIFKDPLTFDYKRHANVSEFLPHLTHLPFGSGPHLCPGWYLYYAISAITVSKLCKNYGVNTTFKGEPEPRIGFVTGIKDSIPITLKRKQD